MCIPVCTAVPILVINICLLVFFVDAWMAKKKSSEPKLSKDDDEQYISHIFLLRAMKLWIGHTTWFCSSWCWSCLLRPPLLLDWCKPNWLCIIITTSFFKCELSQRDTTSATNILNLTSHFSHPLCFQQTRFDQIIISNNWSLRRITIWICIRILDDVLLHIHSTIIWRWVITRIWPKP